MFDPLDPNVTLAQADPVYWQLHRFLHWEDVRDVIPRRKKKNKNDKGKPPWMWKGVNYFNMKNEPFNTLAMGSHQERPPKFFNSTVSDYLEPPQIDNQPIDHRQRIVRRLYADQFKVPLWMADDLDRRPSPAKGAIHPWDIGNEVKLEQNKTTSEAQSPNKSDARLVPAKALTPPKEDKVESISKSVRKVSIKSPPESKDKFKNDILKPTQSKSPGSARGRSKSLGVIASDYSELKAVDKTTKIKHADESKTETKKHYVKSRKELVSEAEEEEHKYKKQPTARQRILAEFRRKRRPKKKKKYVPNSKKIIKPPAVRESWDNVKSSIAGVFNENKDFKPGSRLSLLSADDHDNDGHSTFRSTDSVVSQAVVGLSKRDAKLKAGQTTPSGHLTPIKSAMKNGHLNKFTPLPAIPVGKHGNNSSLVTEHTNSAGVGTWIVQSGGEISRRTVDAASQVGAFDVAINTDVEKRNVGISTKDDVVFIYETVEVERKRKRHKHKHHRNRRGRHRHHHRQNKKGRERKYHNASSSSSESSSSSSSSGHTSPSESSSESPSGFYHHRHQRDRNKQDNDLEVESESSGSGKEKPKKIPSAKVRQLVDEKALKKSILSQLKVSAHKPLSRSNSKQSLDESPRRNPPISRQMSKHSHYQHEALSRNSSKNSTFENASENLDDIGSRQASGVFNTSRRSSTDFDRSPRTDWKGDDHARLVKVSNNHLQLSRQNSKTHAPLVKTSSKAGGHNVISRQDSISQRHQRLQRNDSSSKNHVKRTKSTENAHLSLSRTSSNSSVASAKQPLTRTNSQRLSKQASNQLGRKLSLVQEQPDGKELTPCPHCKRKFLEDRLAIHAKVCQKKKAPRKTFDMAKRRLSNFTSANDTSLLKPQSVHDKKGSQHPVGKQKTNWRENHASFMEQVRYAKKVTQLEKIGGDISSLGPAPKLSTSHLDQCPKCGRKFNSEAIKKHVPVCKAAPVKK